MKELIGLFLVGLFGFAIWKTRQVATTAPRCPTVEELDLINRDILSGTTDLADAENLAKSYDAIKGCEVAATSIRATILAVKSTGTLKGATTPPPMGFTVSPGLVATMPPVDPGLLLVPGSEKAIGPLSVDALSSPLRENLKYLLSKPAAEWTDGDRAIYGALTGVGKPPSPGCGGLQEGQILDDWFFRKAFSCGTGMTIGERNVYFADHPDNALSVLWAHTSGA